MQTAHAFVGAKKTLFFVCDDAPAHNPTRETMGVPFARTARVAPTSYLVVALVACSAAVSAEAPEDALVSRVQDALQTHARGDADAALEMYDAIVRDASAFARLSRVAAATVLNNAGGILYTRGDAIAALPYFERAVRVHPAHAESLVNLAVCLSEDLGKHEEALVAAREATRLRADHAKSHHVLGNILQRLGQMPEAHLRFKTAEVLARGTRAKPEPGSYATRRARRLGETRPSGVFVDDANAAFGTRELVLETVSVVPPVFRVAGFLSERERSRIIEMARPEMERSRTVGDGVARKRGASPRRSETAWIAAGADETTRDVRDRAADLLGIPSSALLRDERLQVLRYERGGYFDVHHESTAFLNRFATLLYYLDGPGDGNGGQTAFPLGPDGEGGGVLSGEDAKDVARSLGVYGGNVTAACSSSIGVRVDPIPGDAVLFFNLDRDGDADPFAIHAACEVTGGEKWAANHWFNVPEKRSVGVPSSERAEADPDERETKTRDEEELRRRAA